MVPLKSAGARVDIRFARVDIRFAGRRDPQLHEATLMHLIGWSTNVNQTLSSTRIDILSDLELQAFFEEHVHDIDVQGNVRHEACTRGSTRGQPCSLARRPN